jgi:hypothetical protein
MRRITGCTAALISLLFVFASISASACDLSCWLRQGQDDCHSGVPMSGQEAGTAMTSTMPMAMSSDQMQHMMAPGARGGTPLDSLINVSLEIGMGHRLTPDRLTPMSPQREMAVERFVELSKPGMNSTALPDHSRDLSSCAHEICSQTSASASPPSAGHAQPDFLHHAPIRFSIATITWTRSDCIKTGSPPPELHAEHLATTLRI